MFAKKLLSIVSTLFIGSQLISVARADENCAYSGNEIETGVASCAGKVYLLNNAGTTKIESGTADGCTSGSKCILVNCPSATCEKSEDVSGLITIASKLFLCSSGDCENKDIATTLTDNFLVNDIAGELLSVSGQFVAKNEGGSIAVDTTFDGADYCIDKNGNVYDRKDGLCKADIDASAEDCTAYYNCDKGVCTVSNANVKPTKKQEGGEEGNPPCIPAADAKCDKGYYLVKAGGLIKDTATDDAVLWYCPGGDNCIDKSGLIGYFKNAVDTSIFIRCTADGKCVGVKPTGTSCVETAKEDGDVTTDTLYNDGAKLCIYDGGDNSFTLTEGYFFVSIKASLLGLKAADAHFIAVNVDDAGNLTVLKETVRYRYTLEGETKIHLRADAKGEKAEGQICNASVTPYEYILDQWTASETIYSGKADYYVTETYYKAQQQA